MWQIVEFSNITEYLFIFKRLSLPSVGCLTFVLWKKVKDRFREYWKFVNWTHNKQLFLWETKDISVKSMVKILSIFVAFLENMNFTKVYTFQGTWKSMSGTRRVEMEREWRDKDWDINLYNFYTYAWRISWRIFRVRGHKEWYTFYNSIWPSSMTLIDPNKFFPNIIEAHIEMFG